MSSVFNMVTGVAGALLGTRAKPATTRPADSVRMRWEDPRLLFAVREPFASKSSRIDLVAGMIEPGQEIALESDMASDGVIFSDGVESDYLEFTAGTTARVHAAKGKAKLVVPG